MPIDIVSYRLHNQRLSQDKFKQADEVVKYLGAVQAQDFTGAKWAIGLRTDGLVDADVEKAFADGSILRTHLMRPTWHFVAPEDIRWLLALTAPRVLAQMAFMDRQLELDRTLFKKSNDTFAKALQGGNHLTRAELKPSLEKARIPAEGLRLGHLLMHAELDGVVCSGPRKGKQFTYALLEERVPAARTWTREEALAELLTRYFLTRGPATLNDFAWWSGLTVTEAKKGMEIVGSRFINARLDGQTYWYAESRHPIREKPAAAYLLPNYDEYFIGFKDRSAIGKVLGNVGIQKDDPALLANIIVLDGQVAGGWKRTVEKEKVVVEASLLKKLTRVEEQALMVATGQFGKFLGFPALLKQKEYSSEQRTSRGF